MQRKIAICMTLALFSAGFVMGPAVPASVADGAPAGTVLLPQTTDFTQQEIDDNWGPDRSAPSVAPSSVSFDGRTDVLHYGVDSDNPTADESDSTFWRTEGIKSERDMGVSVATDLYLDPQWEDRAVRAGIWTVGEDVNGDRADGFGIIEFSTARGWAHPDPVEKDEGWRVWVSGGSGWVNLDTDFTYGEWANLRIELDIAEQRYDLYIDDSLEFSMVIDTGIPGIEPAVGLSEVFLNSYNYGYEDVDPSFSNDSYDVRWHGLDFELAFDSVRDALAAASDGDTVFVGAGTYDEGSSFWRIDKSVTVIGEGSDQVTIDRSAATSYGLLVDTDDVVLEGFTFIGSQTGPVTFGMKIQFLDNLLLKDVVVKDSGRTGIDMNTVTDVTLGGVNATDNGGNGIAIRNAQGVTLEGVHTSGNAWGGLAFYAPGTETVHDVQVVNSTFSGEGAAIYFQYDGYENIQIGAIGAGNDFSGNAVGVLVDENEDFGTPDASGITVRGNSISGNDDGVINEGSGVLDARFNWWGDVSGPLALGDSAGPLGSIKVVPWCLDSACGVLANQEELLDTASDPLPL